MVNNQNKNKLLDRDGIRLAPTPISSQGTKMMPSMHQSFVLHPELVIDDPDNDKTARISTVDDYQPNKTDIRRAWKRPMRIKNSITGLVMLVLSMLVFMPYILGSIEMETSLPFVYSFREFNVFLNIANAFTTSIDANWQGVIVSQTWINAVPDLLLCLGLVFILLNIVKSIIGLFGATIAKRYVVSSFCYLICVLAIFVASLIGASQIGVDKIDLAFEFGAGFSNSEYATLMILAAGNFLFSVIAAIINPSRSGY